MGLLDSLKETALSKANELLGGEHKQLTESIMGLVKGNNQGEGFSGLQGLAKSFEDKGLGNVISSWIGKGENIAVTSQQLQSVLGNEKVQQLATKLGVSTDQVCQQLSKWLPVIIDKLTPDGKIPEKTS